MSFELKICGRNYDKFSFAEKLGWFIVFPIIACVILMIVAIILALVAILIIPCLVIAWFIMLIKLLGINSLD